MRARSSRLAVGAMLLALVGCTTSSPTPTPPPAATLAPSVAPSAAPSEAPTTAPAESPDGTIAPSAERSAAASPDATVAPTSAPVVTLEPTAAPSVEPSIAASVAPSLAASVAPSTEASIAPSIAPSLAPSPAPSAAPSVAPSADASAAPSPDLSAAPSGAPTLAPAESLPPIAAAVSIDCDAFDAEANQVGEELTVTVGEPFIVTLCSRPGTGFSWSLPVSSDASIVALTGYLAEPDASPIPGGPGTQSFAFEVLSAGTATISFSYDRPFEGGETGAWTYQLTVVAS